MIPSQDSPDRVIPGRPVSWRPMAWLARAASAFGRLRGGGRLPTVDGPAGPLLRSPFVSPAPPTFIGQLAGAGPIYDLVQYQGDPSSPSTLVATPSGISCSACCVEVNGVTGLAGKFADAVWPSLAPGGAYFFQWLKTGCVHTLRIHVFHDDGTGYEGIAVVVEHGAGPTVDFSGDTDSNGDIPELTIDPTITYTITITVTTSWGSCSRTVSGQFLSACKTDMDWWVCTGKVCLSLTDCTTGAAISGATISAFSGGAPAFTPAGCESNDGSTTTMSAVVESPPGTYCADYCAIDRRNKPCIGTSPFQISWRATKAGYQMACGHGELDCVDDVSMTGTMMDLSEETDYVPVLFCCKQGCHCKSCAAGDFPVCEDYLNSMILKTLHVFLLAPSGCDGTGSGVDSLAGIPVVWDGVLSPADGYFKWYSDCLDLKTLLPPNGAGPFQCCNFLGPINDFYYTEGRLLLMMSPTTNNSGDCSPSVSWCLWCDGSSCGTVPATLDCCTGSSLSGGGAGGAMVRVGGGRPSGDRPPALHDIGGGGSSGLTPCVQCCCTDGPLDPYVPSDNCGGIGNGGCYNFGPGGGMNGCWSNSGTPSGTLCGPTPSFRFYSLPAGYIITA